MSSMKISTTALADEDELSYTDFLTPEAFKLVKSELLQANEVNVLNDNVVQCKNATFEIEGNVCSCSFARTHALPCRHLIAVRKYKELSTFIPDAVNRRWTLEYSVQRQRLPGNQQQIESSLDAHISKKRTALSEHQKFKKVTAHLNLIATIMTQYGTQTFNRKLKQIECLVSLLQQDKEFIILEVVDETVDTEQDPAIIIHEESNETDRPTLQIPRPHFPSPLPALEVDMFQDAAPATIVAEETDRSIVTVHTPHPPSPSPLPVPEVDVTQDVATTSTSIMEKRDVETDRLQTPHSHFPFSLQVGGVDVLQDVAPTSIMDHKEAVGPRTTQALQTQADKINLGHLTLPGKGKRCRGRPKGAITSSIGLRFKKSRQGAVPFCKKDIKTKQQLILNWYLTDEGQENRMNGETLSVQDIESDAECIPSCVLDPMAAIGVVKEYFDVEGWRKLQALRRERAALPWYCKECGLDLTIHPSIGCDGCLSWSHMKCLHMKIAPKSRYFFCAGCKHNL